MIAPSSSYTLSTSYFLGQRKITLELCSLPNKLPLPKELASFNVESIEIRPIILSNSVSAEADSDTTSPTALVRKRSHQSSGSADEGEPPSKLRGCAAADADQPPEARPVLPTAAIGEWSLAAAAAAAATAGISRLALNYSPYHRAHTRRRLAAPLEGGGPGLGACCYAAIMPPLPGKFDAAAAKALGVPPGPLNGRLVCVCVCVCVCARARALACMRVCVCMCVNARVCARF